ncbi:MAG: hypothetical protein WA990_17010 [Rubrobacteraceae bacterium]
MRLKNVLLAAIGSVLMVGAGVTLVSVLGADATNTSQQSAQQSAPGASGASNAVAAGDSSVKQTNTPDVVAKRSEPGGPSTGNQAVVSSHDGSYDDDAPGSGENEHEGEGGENE